VAYLTRWRMMLAADRLAQGRTTLAMVAPTVGYNSETTETCRQFWQGSRASRVSPDRHAWRKVRRWATCGLEYLTRWRMMLAADRLAQGRTTLAMVAPTVGYNSGRDRFPAIGHVAVLPPHQAEMTSHAGPDHRSAAI
jgi:methylphosphotriester-DNA--protein-cysteine methyltransferase